MALRKKNKPAPATSLATFRYLPEIPDRGAKLEYALRELKTASFRIALICKQIVDEKLYEEAGFDDPAAFFESATPWIGSMGGIRLVQVGNLIEAQPQLMIESGDASESHMVVTKLLQDQRIAQIEREGFVQLTTGEKIPLDEYRTRIAAEADRDLRKKNADAFVKQEEEITRLKRDKDKYKDKYEEKQGPKDDEIARLKKTLDATTNGKLTPEDLVIAASKREAIDIAQKAYFDIQGAIKRLVSIDEEFRTADVVMEVHRTLDAIGIGVKSVREDWSAHFHAHIDQAEA